jgi:hypothetical protein
LSLAKERSLEAIFAGSRVANAVSLNQTLHWKRMTLRRGCQGPPLHPAGYAFRPHTDVSLFHWQISECARRTFITDTRGEIRMPISG